MAMMMTSKIKIPAFANEAFGEWQTTKSLSAIALGAICMILFWTTSHVDMRPWRQIVIGLLALDIAAGAVANFTQGTNDYYKLRPAHRWWFLALHVHLPLLGLTLGSEIWPFMIIWAFTIAAGIAVNLRYGKANQRLLSGLLMCIGIMGVPVLPLSPFAMMISLLFLFKVVFSFAVDHYDN